MAVPVIASSTTAKDETTGLSYTIAKPSGVVSGDVLYIIAATDSATDTITTPTGFTYENDIAATSVARFYLFSRRADGSEGATVTITHAGNRYKSAVYLRVTGVDAGITDLTHQYAELDDTATTLTHTSPSITTTEVECLILSAFLSDNTFVDTWTAGGSETEVADIQNAGLNGMSHAIYRKDEASTGSFTHSAVQSPGNAGEGAVCASMTWAIQSGSVAGITYVAPFDPQLAAKGWF